jgi:hypothetical protein
MSHRIACYTLFDITQTGVMNRSKPNEDDIKDWTHRRNTQCNFDTVLQVISMRSQPEVIKFPIKTEMTDQEFNKFGFLYQSGEQPSYCWKFEFEIQHSSVFENGIMPLGALYKDCEGVPMLVCKDQVEDTPAFLNITEELRNIYFEVV